MERKKRRRTNGKARPSPSDKLATSPTTEAIKQRVAARLEDLVRRSGLSWPLSTQKHPLYVKLLRAYLERQVMLERLVSANPDERERWKRDLAYIESCLVPYQPPPDPPPGSSLFYQAALNLIEVPSGNRAHRRPFLRQRAVEALERHLLDPKHWTWSLLARKLCPKDHEHNFRCQDSLYRTAREVENKLRQLGIELPLNTPATGRKPTALSSSSHC